MKRKVYLGGAAFTEELTLPGFKHDVLATSINFWKASPVQSELELEKDGYREIEPNPVASTPFVHGSSMSIYKDLNLTLKSISHLSEKDPKKFKEIFDFYQESEEIYLGSMQAPPLPFSSQMSALEESDTGLDFLQFSYMSARDWLEENFESEEVKAFLALLGANHAPLSPEAARSAFTVFFFTGLLQKRGVAVPHRRDKDPR